MSMRKRKKVQILSREELMLRRWDFGLVPSERSLEAVGKSVDLHNIGRSMAFDLFPRTYRGKNRCVLRQKHVLINSRERARIWLHTRHQDEAIEPRGDSRSADEKSPVNQRFPPIWGKNGCVFQFPQNGYEGIDLPRGIDCG